MPRGQLCPSLIIASVFVAMSASCPRELGLVHHSVSSGWGCCHCQWGRTQEDIPGDLWILESRGSPRLGACSAPVLPVPRAAEGCPLTWEFHQEACRVAKKQARRGMPTAPPGGKPQMVWCLLTWKPLGRWCPSGQLDSGAAQARKEALTKRPISGCGGRKLLTMWILSSSSEVENRLRNFSICLSEMLMGSRSTIQVTLSFSGGVVRDPG